MDPPPIPEAPQRAPQASPRNVREPAAKKPPKVRRRHNRRGERCLNCDARMERATHFCPHCGQENIDVNISVWHIAREAFEEFLRVDSKMALTLWLLVRRPGELTLEWSKGRRMRYVSPLRLYLTITFFFFLVLSYLHPFSNLLVIDVSGAGATPAASTPKPATGAAEASEALPHVNLHVVKPPADADQTKGQSSKADSATESTNRGAASKPKWVSKVPKWNSKLERSPVFPWVERLTEAMRNPALRAPLLDRFVSHLPTGIFLMLPVFAAALWVLYVRNGRFYVEHLVFALHCHAFLFLLMLGLLLLNLSPNPNLTFWGVLALAIIVPLYGLVALKRNYGQGWIKTIVKGAMLGYAYSVILGLAMVGVLLVAAMSGP